MKIALAALLFLRASIENGNHDNELEVEHNEENQDENDTIEFCFELKYKEAVL